tara:strand:+ start:3654 stop:4124 length:471 start_codon:yes stop_codon:yes gene_type:complete
MKKLPKILKTLIKKKTFSLNSVTNQSDWRGGLKIDYRITMVKAREEDYYEHLTPMNNQWGSNYVNLKVKGYVQTRTGYSGDKLLTEISKATRTRKNSWGGYDSKYDYLWGSQVNKKIRDEIRKKVQKDVVDFLKLLGCSTDSWDGGIKIGTISWEK